MILLIDIVNYLNELKTQLATTAKIKLYTTFSNEKFNLNAEKKFIIADVKNINQTKANISLKMHIKQTTNFDECFKNMKLVIETIENKKNKDLKTENIQVNELVYDNKSQLFYQEIKFDLIDTKNNQTNLIFNSKNFVVYNNTTIRIERKLVPLGSTICGLKFCEFEKPTQKIEGSAPNLNNSYGEFLNFLNSKTNAQIEFQNMKFNATLIKLSSCSQKMFNFNFIGV